MQCSFLIRSLRLLKTSFIPRLRCKQTRTYDSLHIHFIALALFKKTWSSNQSKTEHNWAKIGTERRTNRIYSTPNVFLSIAMNSTTFSGSGKDLATLSLCIHLLAQVTKLLIPREPGVESNKPNVYIWSHKQSSKVKLMKHQILGDINQNIQQLFYRSKLQQLI